MRETITFKEGEISFADYLKRFEALDLDRQISRRLTVWDLISAEASEKAEEIELGRLNKEYFNKTGAEKVLKVLKMIEDELKERPVLIDKIKRLFESSDKDGIVKRYFEVFYIPNNDYDPRKRFYEDGYMLDQYRNSISSGNLDFLELLDLDELRKFEDEFDGITKKIDRNAVEAEEKRISDDEKSARKKEEKKDAKKLPSLLTNEFFYKQKVLEGILELLDIKFKPERYDSKKFENQLINLGSDKLRKIDAEYSRLLEITRKLGGNTREEVDLLLGIEELRDKK